MPKVVAVYTSKRLTEPLKDLFTEVLPDYRLKPQVNAFVLAQSSMAQMEQNLAETTGLPVISSPRLGIEAVKQVLFEG